MSSPIWRGRGKLSRCDVGCVWCYSGRRGRAVRPGHFGYRKARPRADGSQVVAISRRDKSKAQSFDNLVCERCSITSRYPSLWEFLTEAKFADGTDRQAPTMTVFVEGRL